MDKREKKDIISFNLISLKTEQFATFEDKYNSNSEPFIETTLELKIDPINKHIGVFVGFDFISEKDIFITIKISCGFKIIEDSWKKFLSKEKKEVIIPKGFAQHISMISIGTARGVLFEKLENTKFSQFIIPTQNVGDLIKEDVVFKIDEV